MLTKTCIVAAVSVAVCTLAATHRFIDSAHALGVLKRGGSTTRHPAKLDGREETTTLIVTARVIPPLWGDARVVLEGAPDRSCSLHNAEPALRLPFLHRPTFRDQTYFDLRPNDRIALWVVLKKRDGSAPQPSVTAAPAATVTSCCPQTAAGGAAPASRESRGPQLAFYDTRSNERLLTVPISFGSRGGSRHGD